MQCIIELQYLPLLSIYGLLASHELVIIESQEHYQKGSYRNKTIIAGPNSLQTISLPLKKGKHGNLPITSVQLSYNTDWTTTHLRTISTAYGTAPFFDHYYPEIEAIHKEKPASLWELNLNLLRYINSRTGNLLRIDQSKTYRMKYDSSIADYRDKFRPAGNGKTHPILPADFAYSQVHTDRYGFRSPVTILDLLMHRGPESQWVIEELAQYYKRLRTEVD